LKLGLKTAELAVPAAYQHLVHSCLSVPVCGWTIWKESSV